MKYIVIGGGPAGCAAAYTLSKEGHQVDLFEASDSVGGRTKRLVRGDFKLATGALFLMGDIYPRTTALLKEMGHSRALIPWGGDAELMDSDNARYSVNFLSLASYLSIPKLTFSDKVKVVMAASKLHFRPKARNAFDGSELAQYDQGENLEEWSRKNLGTRAYEYIVRPLMDFLYAVPASWLATPFPLAIIQQAHKMQLSVPPEDIGQISDWLIQHSLGLQLHLSSPVSRIEKIGSGFCVHAADGVYEADGLVVATEAFVAADLLRESLSEATINKLEATSYTNYAHVAIAYEKNPWPDYPVDIVLPVGAGETRNVGAIVLHSRRLPSSVPAGGEVAGVYFNTPPLPGMSDEDIKQEALDMVARAFGKAPPPSFVHLFRYERGLTIAQPGHYRMLDSVHAEMPPGVFLAGDYFSQAGVEAAVSSGERAATALHNTLRNLQQRPTGVNPKRLYDPVK